MVPIALEASPQYQPSVILYCDIYKKISLKTGCFSRGGLVVWGYRELTVIVWSFLGAKYLLLEASGPSRFLSVT